MNSRKNVVLKEVSIKRMPVKNYELNASKKKVVIT